MKRLLLLTLMLGMLLSLEAQQFTVYRVKGNANSVVKKVKHPLQKGMTLTVKNVVNLDKGSELKLFDQEHREMVTLRGQCAGSIGSIVAAQQGSRQSMTAKYFAFIVNSLTSKTNSEDFNSGRTTAIFRGDTDSLLVGSLDAQEFYPLFMGLQVAPVPVAAGIAEVSPLLRPVSVDRLNIPTTKQYVKLHAKEIRKFNKRKKYNKRKK